MAEAFAALSIAANIAQFVVYAKQLIAGGKEIYNSLEGAQDEHKALGVIIEDIRHLRNETASSSDDNLLRLAAECGDVADKLFAILEDLKVPNDTLSRPWQTMRQTLRSATKKKDIQKLQQRLDSIDARLRDRTLRLLQKKHYSNITSTIKTLTRKNEELKINTDQTLEKLWVDIIQTLEKQADAPGNGYAELQNLSKQLLALAKESKNAEREQQILASLIFEEMQQREEVIKEAHKVTLNWMFEKNEIKFMDWLKTEKGIYWVKGKAGSGKSTLMKHICNHNITLDALRSWAGCEELFTASFFFWNSGLPMQKSQTGLLQSLLYQLLRSCPKLILQVCPPKGAKEPWRRKELFETLYKISRQNVLPAKFCFFIDGLDEYEGESEEIIALLQDLASSPSVKICASSRPWNAFLDAFDDSRWKLVLEDLTKDDMRKYVHTMLVENESFSKMAKHDPRCKTLVPKIAEKAQGARLWVWLVVRDLLRDLKGEEEFPLLQRRLDSFPEELEKYFENIIGRIDKIHQNATAKIFLMALTAAGPIPLISLKYLDMEAEDPDYALKLGISPISEVEVFQTKTKWKKLLNSRCRDLLEVSQTINQNLLDNEIGFLHRTVRDFLRDNYQEELLKLAGSQFDARYSLCSTIVSLIKIWPPLPSFKSSDINIHNSNPSLLDLAVEVLYYAREFESKTGQSMTVLLDELNRSRSVQMKYSTGYSFYWTSEFPSRWPFEALKNVTFIAMAIGVGLRLYVKEKLDCNKTLVSMNHGRPLLSYALRPIASDLSGSPPRDLWASFEDITADLYKDEIDIQMVRLLLKLGSDPNEGMVWSLFLNSWLQEISRPFIGQPDPRVKNYKTICYEAIEIMIDHGADPKVRINAEILEEMARTFALPRPWDYDDKREKVPQFNTLEDLLEPIFGHERAARLKLRIDEKTQRNSIFKRLFRWR